MSLHLLPRHVVVWSDRVHSPEREPGLGQQQSWDQDPDPIKEDKVDPQVEPAGRVQVGTANQPIRTEGHPATAELAHAQSDLQEVPVKMQNLRSELHVPVVVLLTLSVSTASMSSRMSRVQSVVLFVVPVVLVLQYCMYEQQGEDRVEHDCQNFYRDDRRIRNQPATVSFTVLLPYRQTDRWRETDRSGQTQLNSRTSDKYLPL